MSQQIPKIGRNVLTEEQAQQLADKYSKGLSKANLLFFDQNGYVVLPNILSTEQCDAYIQELWDIIERVDNKQKIKRPQKPLENLSSEQKKRYDKNWIPWKSYGMISEPHVYHTKAHWELRTRDDLYQIFCQLYQNEKLWCSIDRANVLLPKQGVEEFNHWDWDPWHPEINENIQAIVNLSERNFRCVPGSNCEKWQQKFKNDYKYLSSNVSRTQVQLDEKKDPWKLGQQMQNITCPKGSYVIFNSRTMHSVAKNLSDKIKYGMYLSFFPAGNRDEMGVYNTETFKYELWHPWAQEGDTEVADRIRSFNQGTSPYRYPGGGISQYVTPRAISSVMSKRSEKSLKTLSNGKKWIVENKPEYYEPYKLNNHGKRVLGLIPYEGEDEYELKLGDETLKKLKKDYTETKREKRRNQMQKNEKDD